MTTRNDEIMPLSPEDLNEWDKRILDYLGEEGRATPTLLVAEFTDRGQEEVSRQWVNSRLTRLAEHGHVRNLHDTGVYEHVDDPRQE